MCRVLYFFITLFIALPTKAHVIWFEAEDYKSGSISRIDVFSDGRSINSTLLSNQAWVGQLAEKQVTQGRAHYEIHAPVGGEYFFYVRKHWYNTAFKYRFNDQDWTEVQETRLATLKGAEILNDDLRVDWMALESVELIEGKNQFDLVLTGKERDTAIDCFVLSTKPVDLVGLRKPGEKLGKADTGFWAFEPEADPFTDDAIWDLRYLNETVAGQRGSVALSEDKNAFVLADGQPVRFWAMNTNVAHGASYSELERHARHLAKRGFNMARFFGAINSKNEALMKADTNEIERSWRFVSAMKKQGIYSTLSPYWATHTARHPEWTSLPSGNDHNLASLLFFEPNLQSAYKSWLKQWLTTVNPYTGVPLAQDSAVAIIQIQNEDSMLFGTQRRIQGEQRRILETQFYNWVIDKYGSANIALSAWNKSGLPEDELSKQRLGLYDIAQFTPGSDRHNRERLKDQYHFYLETMRNWNREVARYLREDLGYQGLINAGNWRTINNETMLDGERWSYSVNDIMAVNRYYNGGVHINPSDQTKAGYRISNGDLLQGESVLFHPRQLPINIKQVNGYPMIVSESTWAGSQRHQSEAPFLVSAYSSLSGLDIFYWFSTRVESFDSALVKFPSASPALMTTYPAAALMFRKQYIRQGEPAIEEHRTLSDIFYRSPPVISEEPGFDPNRDRGIGDIFFKREPDKSTLAFLVGPVISHYESEQTHASIQDLDKFIDNKSGVITSNTNELRFDYKQGLATVDTSRAQGASGFLRQAGEIKLTDTEIISANDYLTVLVVSMDEKPITNSQRVLVQVTSQSRPYGYKTEPARFNYPENKWRWARFSGYRLIDQGRPPMNYETAKLKLRIRSSTLKFATVTDANGYKLNTTPLDIKDGWLELSFPEKAVYMVLSEQPSATP